MIDAIDLKILYILQNNGRKRLADIADEVELSAPAVMERVKKLEASGVIRGYQALIDSKKVGKDITAFIGVSIGNQSDIDHFAQQMLRYGDVLECHHVTGDESFILKVKSANTGFAGKTAGRDSFGGRRDAHRDQRRPVDGQGEPSARPELGLGRKLQCQEKK